MSNDGYGLNLTTDEHDRVDTTLASTCDFSFVLHFWACKVWWEVWWEHSVSTYELDNSHKVYARETTTNITSSTGSDTIVDSPFRLTFRISSLWKSEAYSWRNFAFHGTGRAWIVEGNNGPGSTSPRSRNRIDTLLPFKYTMPPREFEKRICFENCKFACYVWCS